MHRFDFQVFYSFSWNTVTGSIVCWIRLSEALDFLTKSENTSRNICGKDKKVEELFHNKQNRLLRSEIFRRGNETTYQQFHINLNLKNQKSDNPDSNWIFNQQEDYVTLKFVTCILLQLILFFRDISEKFIFEVTEFTNNRINNSAQWKICG